MWSGKILYVILVCWNGLWLILLPSWLIVLFNTSRSLLTFCLLVLSTAEKGVLKSPTLIVNMSIFLFSSISFYIIYFWISVIRCIISKIIIYFWWIDSFDIMKWFSLVWNLCCRYWYGQSSFLLSIVGMLNLYFF